MQKYHTHVSQKQIPHELFPLTYNFFNVAKGPDVILMSLDSIIRWKAVTQKVYTEKMIVQLKSMKAYDIDEIELWELATVSLADTR